MSNQAFTISTENLEQIRDFLMKDVLFNNTLDNKILSLLDTREKIVSVENNNASLAATENLADSKLENKDIQQYPNLENKDSLSINNENLLKLKNDFTFFIAENLDELNSYAKNENFVFSKEDDMATFICKILQLLLHNNQNQEKVIKSYESEALTLKNNLKTTQEQINNLNHTVLSLNKEIEEYDSKLSKLNIEKLNYEKCLNEKKEQVDELKSYLNRNEQKLVEIERENANIKDKFSDVEPLADLYNLFLSLSVETKEKIKNMVRFDSFESFLSCCTYLSTWDDVWDYVNLTKNETYSQKSKDIKILASLFKYFILLQNKRYKEKNYAIIEPLEGTVYNPLSSLQINQKSSGVVSSVVFPGYGTLDINSKEKETIKKVKKQAIVILE